MPKSDDKRILVATTNPGKIRELRAMLDAPVEWLGLDEFEGIEEVEEDGTSFEENARKKALGYAEATGLWTVADDSGLVIDALNGEPGIHSARYSGEKEKAEDRSLIDHKNIAKVLSLMRDVPDEQRTGRFVCAMCLGRPGEVLAETRGTVEGLITRQQRGEGGFGYDPIFYVPDRDKTMAQLNPDEKNSISHRSNAVKKLKPVLKKLLRER